MAIQFGVKEILTEVGKYGFGIVTGTGITLLGLLAWTGADDLETIKSSVDTYVTQADGQVSALLSEYSVTVDNANAEIGEYKVALGQANDNIDKLITGLLAKEQELATKEGELTAKQEELLAKQEEFENLQADFESKEVELEDLQTQFEDLQTQLAENYVSVSEVNEVIAKANEEIDKANQEVADTKDEVQGFIDGSNITKQSVEERLAETGKVLDTGNDKSVNDITGIVE